MKAIRSLIILCITAMFFSSCITQNLVSRSKKDETNVKAETQVFAYDPNYVYTLKKDDKINISIWDHDDMSVGSIYGIYNSNEVYGKWLMLDADGNVEVPKLGTVNLMGLTVAQAKQKLSTELKKWIVNPIVEVKVLNKEVTILGELKTPGKYLLEKDEYTLLDIIAKAGDLDFYAEKRKIEIIRNVDGKPVSHVVDLTKVDNLISANVQIHPGDIIYVPSRSGKHWDRRAGSTVVPIASVISTAVLIWGLVK